MISNGKEMIFDGHKLVFKEDLCSACFFADKDECPDCDEGIWVEEGYPWHTEPPTEDGEYVVLCKYRKDDGKLRIYKTVFEFKNGEWTNLPILENHLDEYELIAWYGQKIEPYEETSK